jgi:hypothetical protein
VGPVFELGRDPLAFKCSVGGVDGDRSDDIVLVAVNSFISFAKTEY